MPDLVLRGGRVIDGAGNPPVAADVLLHAGRIAAVDKAGGMAADVELDVSGLFVCPGFIDMHTHSDLQILSNPTHDAKARQGVTLDVLGQDGLGYAPITDGTAPAVRQLLREWNEDERSTIDIDWRTLEEYAARLDAGVSINTTFLAPHGTIRMAVMGLEGREATERELDKMMRLLADCMEHGAVGLSTGLQYVPAVHASTYELVQLCSVVSRYGGYFCPHHRNYGRDAMQAYSECIEVAQRSGVALHLAHVHLSYPVNAGRAHELIAMLDGARRQGTEITFDAYPYVTGNPYLRLLLPSWMAAGGNQATLARLANHRDRERLRVALEIEGFEGVPVDWNALEISSVADPGNEMWHGLTIAEAARRNRRSPLDFFCDLLISDRLCTSVFEHIGNEENVRALMKHVGHMPASDGILVGNRPHPRGWGTFPRYLGHYVRELGILTWEQAVRKMTSLPAQRLGLWDRGLVRPGLAADLVCFDPDSVQETASFAEPRQYPRGIPHVIVNGVLVVHDGQHTGRFPGRFLRRRR
jgi:N-acyl-D-amino-acid deacylase